MGRHWAANGCPPLCGYVVSEERSKCRLYLPYLGTIANKQCFIPGYQESLLGSPRCCIWYLILLCFSVSLLELKRHKSICGVSDETEQPNCKLIDKQFVRSREMAGWLQSLAAFCRGSELNSQHPHGSSSNYNFISRGFDVIFWLPQVLQAHGAQTHMQENT